MVVVSWSSCWSPPKIFPITGAKVCVSLVSKGGVTWTLSQKPDHYFAQALGGWKGPGLEGERANCDQSQEKDTKKMDDCGLQVSGEIPTNVWVSPPNFKTSGELPTSCGNFGIYLKLYKETPKITTTCNWLDLEDATILTDSAPKSLRTLDGEPLVDSAKTEWILKVCGCYSVTFLSQTLMFDLVCGLGRIK
jgi:hypothetical protein